MRRQAGEETSMTADGGNHNHPLRQRHATRPEEVPFLPDQYFLKTKEIVRRFGDKRVTYAIFLRRPVVCTPRLMIEFLERMAADRGTKFDIELPYAEGDW